MRKKTEIAVTTPPGTCETPQKINVPDREPYDVAIEALVAGESVTNAAALAGVRRETLSRWLHRNPAFISRYNEKQNEARRESLSSINSIVSQSAAALRVALRHPDINPTAVVQSIMSMLPKMYAALLAQGDDETDLVLIFMAMQQHKKKFADQAGMDEYMKRFKTSLDYNAAEELRDKYPDLYEKRKAKYDEMIERGRKEQEEYENGNLKITG
jgi:hypothetical protein